MECRSNSLAVTFEQRDDKPAMIRGYGAVFYNQADAGTEYRLWPDMVERIMAGAFKRAIAEDDVRSLFNHDSNIILGRNKSGTLTISEDSRGLYYEVSPPDTQFVRDSVLSPIKRGDVTGSSFMFLPEKVTWAEERQQDGTMLFIRQIDSVQLAEVGPVVFPAYESTTTSARSKTQDLDAIIEERNKALNRNTTSDISVAWQWVQVSNAEKMF